MLHHHTDLPREPHLGPDVSLAPTHNQYNPKPVLRQKYIVPLHDGSGAEATLDDLSDGGARKHRRMDENASSSFLRKKERKHTHTENNIL